MSILYKVQEKYPEIKRLIPASEPLEVPVRTAHRKGAKANHMDCTMSRAVKELTGADDVYTTLSSVVVVKGGEAVQYRHGSGSRDLVTVNDTRGEVVDQRVWLNAPSQKQQICSMLRSRKDGVPKKLLQSMFSQAGARINELRSEGHKISSERGCDKWVTYKYISGPRNSKAVARRIPKAKRKYRKLENGDLLREHA